MHIVIINKMAPYRYRTLAELMIMAAILHFNGVSGARISTAPSTITVGGLNPTAQLRITCTPITSGDILVLEIGRQLTPGDSASNKAIVHILSANPTTVTVVDTSLQQRMESSGSITTSTGNLEISLTDLRCSDADYPYYCATTVNTAGGVRINEDSSNITVRSNPGDIAMTLNPDFSVYSKPEILVEFLCTGLIGNQFDQNMNMANYWVWEWRYVDNLNSPWVQYPNTNNITYRAPTPNPSGSRCQYDGGSTLTHTVTTLDNGRQFRCYVVSPEYGNNRTVYTQALGTTDGPNAERYPSFKDFYCTEHTHSSVTIQWVFNYTKYSSFKFDLKFRHEKGQNWNKVSTSRQDKQPSILHTLQVTQLQSNSLYFFRLSVGEGQPSQSWTVACFTERNFQDQSESYSSSLGIGVVIGITVMLLLGGLCLVAFIYRRRGASHSSGGMKSNKPDTPSSVQRPETEITQTTRDGEYEMPGNFYDGFQGRSVETPTTYEKLATYQNT